MYTVGPLQQCYEWQGSLRSWEGGAEKLEGTRLESAWKNQQAVNIRELSKLTNKDNMIKKGK
jgi:hypothetical protein